MARPSQVRTLVVPPEDMAEFARLPSAARAEVEAWAAALEPLFAARRGVGEAIRGIAARLGTSAQTARRKWDAARMDGWRGLVNRARTRDGRSHLPDALIERFRELCERNQRKSKPAWRQLVAEWSEARATGGACPGYAAAPAPSAGGVPKGWTYRNMMRAAGSTPFDLCLSRQGPAHAAEFRPKVFTTRVGLEAGQFYLFDDLWHDLMVVWPGVSRRSMRPLEFACLDLFSGCKVAWGCKPRMEDEETGRMVGLKEREMRFLLAHVLTRLGYRQAGTTLVVEHGTAAIRPELEAYLGQASGGAIRVERSGIEGASALAGAYAGRSKGNFRFKAALESSHNLAHNELAALPGQVGRNRDESPEELHGRTRHADGLLAALSQLPPERSALLRFPFVEFGEFCRILAEVYRRINGRTDHELEGWLEAGLVAHEIVVDPEQQPVDVGRFAALPAHRQEALAALVAAHPEMARARRLSPTEVWERGRGRLVRLGGHCIPGILGEAAAVERRVQADHMFEFEDRELSAGALRFAALAVDPEGREIVLPPGEAFRTWCNPFDPSVLHVADERGRYVGECAAWGRPTRSDVEGVRRQMGKAAHLEATLLAPVRARGQALARAKTEMHKHNAAVLAGEPVTPEEIERAKTDRRRIRGTTGDVGDAHGAPRAEEREAAEEERAEAVTAALEELNGG